MSLLNRLASVTALGLITLSTVAAAPSRISYQGLLADASGNPVADGNYSVLFTIYDSAVNGTSKWSETQTVSTKRGLFTVLLGSVNAIADSVFAGSTRYLGVRLGANAEMTPRTMIVAVPYAMRVSTVDGTSGGVIAGEVSIGFDHTNTGYLSSILGGFSNEIFSSRSVVGGGHNNAILALGDYATVGGGRSNTATADYATIPGGFDNDAAGIGSFAAGRNAKARHDGCFVWSDGSLDSVFSVDENQFMVRASGGIYLGGNGVKVLFGAGPNLPISKGSYYTDNAIVAWGKVSGNGSFASNEFGVTSVTRTSAGNYSITIDATAMDAALLIPMAIAEVDAPPNSAASARIVSVNQTGVSTFSVYILNGNYSPIDNDFIFMVTAR